MESGHSHMEVDCVHSTVERAGAANKIYTPFDWFTVVRSCRPQQPYNVIELEHQDFFDHKKASSAMMKNKNQADDGPKILWTKLKWIRHTQDDLDAIFVKTRLQDELPFTRVPIKYGKGNRNSQDTLQVAPLFNQSLTIKPAKYKDLMTIPKDLPENRRGFFESLKPSSCYC